MKLVIIRQIFLGVITFSLVTEFILGLKTKTGKAKTKYSQEPASEEASGSGGEAATAGSSSNSTNSNYTVDLTDPNIQLAEWMTVSSKSFLNRQKYPIIKTEEEETELKLSDTIRVNEKFTEAEAEGSKNEFSFWFKIRGGYIYYFSTKEDINILGSILAKRVEDSSINSKFTNEKETCFKVFDYAGDKYTICAMDYETKLKWLCSIQSLLKQTVESQCLPNEERKVGKVSLNQGDNNIVELKKISQPMIIIPVAARNCNDKWNYQNNGEDWECQCADGKEQSPINLPDKEEAHLSNLRPMFQYNIVHAKAPESTKEGLVKDEIVKIRYEKEALRIRHPNMGKIVTLDGGVFRAEEIVFHTPSEHQVNNHTFDMEMQIIHYGKSKGDIAKQIVLSFFFKAKPGVYNKFLDKLDFFSLPNQVDDIRDITQDFFIPSIFFTTEEDDVATMPPFSFYTYEGSLTAPPCTERTTHYVAADPIPVSNTVLELFKEALKKPDMEDPDTGEVIESDDEDIKNNRMLQPLNGRSVYIYDHIKFNCPEFKKKTHNIKPQGHYEKKIIQTMQYIYVPGSQPSKIPNSFVVTKKEALGRDGPVEGDEENNSAKLG